MQIILNRVLGIKLSVSEKNLEDISKIHHAPER